MYVKSGQAIAFASATNLFQSPSCALNVLCSMSSCFLNLVDIDRLRRFIFTTNSNSLVQSCQAKISLSRQRTYRQHSRSHNVLPHLSGESWRILPKGEGSWLC